MAEEAQRTARQAEAAVRQAVGAAAREHQHAVEAEIDQAKREIASVLAGPLARLRAAEAKLVPGGDLDKLAGRLVANLNATGGK